MTDTFLESLLRARFPQADWVAVSHGTGDDHVDVTVRFSELDLAERGDPEGLVRYVVERFEPHRRKRRRLHWGAKH
jgi:hypothetical protein